MRGKRKKRRKSRENQKIKKVRVWFLGVILCLCFLVVHVCFLADDSGNLKIPVFSELFFVRSGQMVRTEDGDRGAAGTLEDSENAHAGQKTGKDSSLKRKKIRVLIKTSGFSDFYHERIEITSNHAFWVRCGRKRKKYAPKQKIRYLSGELSGSREIQILPEEGGRLRVLSLNRQGGIPSYRGTLRIRQGKDGLLLVNILPFEEYLYAVVSSEISASSHEEALKAQAVCARTYAYQKRKASRYEEFGADMDDSDSCQVYNNFPETPEVRKAVCETEGLILAEQGKPIPVYYFSTSWGYTASGQSAWNTDEKIPYLSEKFQITESCQKETGQNALDLSKEAVFRSFLEDGRYRTYDSDSPWYRWKVRFSLDACEEMIQIQLKKCYDAYPNLVLFLGKDGKFHRGAFRDVGRVRTIKIEKREKSGLVTELRIEGEDAVAKIRTQYSIRQFFAPFGKNIVLQNGEKRALMKLLPSAAFYLEQTEVEGKRFFTIHGGGFGHGTGMSQWGARVQAEQGWSFQKILKHYFSGISILKL